MLKEFNSVRGHGTDRRNLAFLHTLTRFTTLTNVPHGINIHALLQRILPRVSQ